MWSAASEYPLRISWVFGDDDLVDGRAAFGATGTGNRRGGVHGHAGKARPVTNPMRFLPAAGLRTDGVHELPPPAGGSARLVDGHEVDDAIHGWKQKGAQVEVRPPIEKRLCPCSVARPLRPS